MRRLAVALGTLLVAGSVLSTAGVASAAGTHVKPTITATEASFTIPSSPTGVWQLGLTTYPPPVTHLGRVQGTSGILTLPVPHTDTCSFQVDVKFQAGGVGPFVMYSSIKAVVPGCGGTGTRFTPGYWKNHEAATTALLPQTLGGFTVSTFAEAHAIFVAMKCSNAVNCLAGHLLAAQLDVANGSSTCIAGTISDANAFLTSVGYAGPGSYSISSSQRAQAISLAQALDKYTNDSNSPTC
ncbi:MAG: hypothetical protein J2P30_22365 [Actinobacteria bacterium]|nr:hypothetical protein [Actinomycetota bacterium]